MQPRKPSDSLVDDYERALGHAPRDPYVLRLYVTGSSPRSLRAVSNLRELCEGYLSGRYDLEVVDLYRDPGMASEKQIVAAPTLVRESPLPERRVIGDLSDKNRVLFALDLVGKPN